MSTTDKDFELPTNPDHLKRIKGALEEIVGHERFRADKQEAIKDIKTMLKEEFDMTPALTGKLVKAFHDDDYQDIIGANSTFEFVREAVLGDGGQDDDSATA
jgi:hypothetical protein